MPAAWIDTSFQALGPTGNGDLRHGDQGWRGALTLGERRLDWVAAMGNGGQRLVLVPDLDLLVVVTAGNCTHPDSWRAPMEVFRSVAGAWRRSATRCRRICGSCRELGLAAFEATPASK